MEIKKKILVADDDEGIRICMEDISVQEGWDLLFAHDGLECLELIHSERPALVILDQRMPNMTGEEVLAHLESEGYSPPVILISAERNIGFLRRFPSILHIFNKPFDLEEFTEFVSAALGGSLTKAS